MAYFSKKVYHFVGLHAHTLTQLCTSSWKCVRKYPHVYENEHAYSPHASFYLAPSVYFLILLEMRIPQINCIARTHARMHVCMHVRMQSDR